VAYNVKLVTKFRKDLLRGSVVGKGQTTHTHTHSQNGDVISLRGPLKKGE
jgi:hypothetical protein